jgi:hypothetical protein
MFQNLPIGRRQHRKARIPPGPSQGCRFPGQPHPRQPAEEEGRPEGEVEGREGEEGRGVMRRERRVTFGLGHWSLAAVSGPRSRMSYA